jgi:hypothetical protein
MDMVKETKYALKVENCVSYSLELYFVAELDKNDIYWFDLC